jgi:UDP-N-acetylglucosamine diphosphorylase/glucosamine-1-phosphate N-acetyltransferase
MQTVVLAAGQGTRMRPLTAATPKPMLPVADRPLVAHTVDAAVAAGATKLVLVVGYEADRVRAYFDSVDLDVDIEYVVQEEQRGTADAVRTALPALDDAEPFVVLNGDALYDLESLKLLYGHVPSVGAFSVDHPENYGVFTLADDGDATTEPASAASDGGYGGQVVAIEEKPANPKSNLVNTGAYTFPPQAHEMLEGVEMSERGELELTDVLAQLCASDEVRAVPFERWMDVGRPWELLEANEWKLGELERRIEGDVHEDAVVEGNVVVEEGATIRSGVVIEGPVLVKSGATVGPNAYIRGATLIGENVHVGNAVEIKNSVLMADTNVGHLSYVGDSILGEKVNFGAGTKVANLRHDGDEVKMTIKGDRVSTDRRKMGVVVGGGTKTGINTSLNAGVVLSEDARTGLGEAVTRDK